MRMTVALAVACLIAGMSVAAESGASAKKYDLNIPRQSLDMALKDLAQQTGLQIARMSDTIDGAAMVGPVSGSLTPKQALDNLLSTQGLSYTLVNDRTIAIVKPGTATADDRNSISEVQPIAPRNLQIAQNNASSENQGNADNQKSDSSSSSTSSDGEENKLAEIVVTAQKRLENVKDVPISMTVLGGDRLDNSSLTDMADTLNTVPGIVIQQDWRGSSVMNPTIRGVQSLGFLGNAAVVGYYLDSVPFAFVRDGNLPDTNVYDLERLEVLRGPQGTLYGASSLNGVIRVLTNDANLEDFEVKARGLTSSTEGGDLNYRGDLVVNVPLVKDRLAVRAVGSYQNLGGWVDKLGRDNANDMKNRTFRLKLNGRPTDQLSVGAFAWFSRVDENGGPVAADDGSYDAVDEPNHTDFDAYGLKLTYEFPWASISSMSSYINSQVGVDVDFGPFGFTGLASAATTNAKIFAQEVVLTSTQGGPWRWTLGGMYRDAKSPFLQTLNDSATGDVLLVSNDYKDTSESVAIYGEITRAFLSGRLELTGGLRSFEDKAGIRGNLTPISPVTSADTRFHHVSPRAVLTWHASRDLTAYASYAEGFRSGLFQTPLSTSFGFPPAKPDKLASYEVGTKGRLLDGALDFELALFYLDWRNVQQGGISLPITINGSTFPVGGIVNTGTTSGPGFEFAVNLHPLDRLTFGTTVGWNDVVVEDNVYDIANPTALVVKKGFRASSKWTAGASADYTVPLSGSGWEGRFSASANYTSRYPNLGGCCAPPQGPPADNILTSGVRFAVKAPQNWIATLFIDNLNNTNDRVYAITTASTPQLVYTRVRPRTIGLQVEYHLK